MERAAFVDVCSVIVALRFEHFATLRDHSCVSHGFTGMSFRNS